MKLYPDAKSHTSLQDGIKYQRFIQNYFWQKWNKTIHYYESKRDQYKIGESFEAIEVKYDYWCTITDRLSIEIAEKSRKDERLGWTPSGIYRKDNTIFYIQGNYRLFFVFLKPYLVFLHNHYAFKEESKLGTIKTFYLPLSLAMTECKKYIDFEANYENIFIKQQIFSLSINRR